MSTVVIALTDFVADPEDRVDLASMPENEAASRVKEALSFLPPSAQVSIKKGVATITLAEATAKRTNEALKKYARAQKHALRGEYAAAVEFYQQALEDLPGHTEARRNLAMAQLESGDREASKRTLAQVLRLDPKDAWTYVLLGNIYYKHENNHERGERHYRRAWELNPRDAVLLANLGALMVDKGSREQAEEFFNRAIEANPNYPHPYYGLALLNMRQGETARALATLDSMFQRPVHEDSRAVPMYGEARKLYLDASKALAAQTQRDVAAFLDQRKLAVEKQTGYAIELVEDNSLEYVAAVAELAWYHGRDVHRVKYRDRGPVATPHLVAHELEHIVLEDEARRAGRKIVRNHRFDDAGGGQIHWRACAPRGRHGRHAVDHDQGPGQSVVQRPDGPGDRVPPASRLPGASPESIRLHGSVQCREPRCFHESRGQETNPTPHLPRQHDHQLRICPLH
jgi:tetratricopeptide (TPR) repeat protein